MNFTQCLLHQGPRLPHSLHVLRFSSVDQAFETPMESLLYKHVKGPLTQLLGGKFFSTSILTPTGYTIGKLQGFKSFKCMINLGIQQFNFTTEPPVMVRNISITFICQAHYMLSLVRCIF